MKFSILIDILFDLLSKRKVTANYLAEKYEISPRTVYRYVEVLAQKLPLFIKRGRNGGICLADNYRLPVGFMTADEYTAALDALISAYERDPDPRFLNAKRKLSAQVKTEKSHFATAGDADGFFVEETFPALSEKARVLSEAIREEMLVEITQSTENVAYHIEPHALVLKQNVWFVYAFCHLRRKFHLFPVGNIAALVKTDEPFRRRPFAWTDIPSLGSAETKLPVRLEIAENILPKVRNTLGAETLTQTNGKWYAELSLPDSDITAQKLLSLGAGIKVLSPTSLKEKVLTLAKEIVKNYT